MKSDFVPQRRGLYSRIGKSWESPETKKARENEERGADEVVAVVLGKRSEMVGEHQLRASRLEKVSFC